MDKDKYSNEIESSRQKYTGRIKMLVLSLLLIIAIAIGGTIAYLSTNTNAIENAFELSNVSCEVSENFNGTIKSDVNVTNTSNIEAYIRVKLVTYRVNNEGNRIGGTATIPDFTPGAGWVLRDGYYYYTKAVAAGEKPETNLINSIQLEGKYSDADGGRQVIEVMAEVIQAIGTDSSGKTAVELSWGIDPSTLN